MQVTSRKCDKILKAVFECARDEGSFPFVPAVRTLYTVQLQNKSQYIVKHYLKL